MKWAKLMSRRRLTSDQKFEEVDSDEKARSEFERDWDRILFSTAFRRMHDKTQVFPLPEDDLVHSRLTHSLEVASVGRSLGKLAGDKICKNHRISKNIFDPNDIGGVVAAACLAHDIGNPPLAPCR
jgi:dGTPase